MWFSLFVFVAVGHAGPSGSPLLSCNPTLYRTGERDGCGRMPECWSCAARHPLAFNCASRANSSLPVNNATLKAPFMLASTQLRVGDAIDSQIILAGADEDASNWNDCVAGLLPRGIHLSPNGKLIGTVQYDASRPAMYHFDIVAFASTSQSLWRFEGPGLVVNNVCAMQDASSNEKHAWMTSSERTEARNAGFEALNAFENYWVSRGGHSRNYQLATAIMSRNRDIMTSLLSTRRSDPSAHDEWLLLGVVEMRRHKLMVDVLLDAEDALTQALLLRLSSSDFGSNNAWPRTDFEWASLGDRDSYLANVRSNLDGCLAKRKLEAAKALYDRAVDELRGEGRHEDRRSSICQTHKSFAAANRAVQLLERAFDLKEGWGWGMDQVTIRSLLIGLKSDWQGAVAKIEGR